MKNCQEMPPLDLLHKLFKYYKRSGKLTRRIAGKGGKAPAGTAVGSPNASGHLRVKIKSRGYAIHRLIWFMVTGIDPCEKVVDHKDLNPANNKWSNLRLVDHSTNSLNSDRVNHSKIYPGVHKRRGKWLARICVDYRRIHLGYFSTVEEAIRARKQAEIQLAKQRNDSVLLARGTNK